MANTTGKKYGGRQKGTPNKLTFDLRATISDILGQELESIHERLERLDDKERLDIIVRLLPYAIPKMSEINTPQVEPKKLVLVVTDKDI
jgi:hypothetical protein